jgi:hypothetical protein
MPSDDMLPNECEGALHYDTRRDALWRREADFRAECREI